ncbi:IPT/TIG domain-containing protein [Deinococcus cellulosilyticus]|uniref:Uncharacterized protein n=1 Tax=Deinococcus cellulosilyticus (strain DSM 18568 / NBRC 106333 / KACC 11606 / 5516J-15) TaxID=1223518 RepID=A0A511N7B7_DEIC1|nr:IPT/TIG domain-containing protein [Deinococcus cellulosilyticus]GEM48356.1 hypothetical protein DC3_39910 [Deinococcus cellulosilyticus NBRC 106333 = KACC 11606]
MKHLKPSLLFLLAPIMLAACASNPSAPTRPQPVVRGAVELTFELGPAPTATAIVLPQAVRPDTDVKFLKPAAYTDYDDTSGHRYMNATFTVKNLSAQPFDNLTLYAYHKAADNIGGTALKKISNAAGTPITDSSVARAVLPSHGTAFDVLSGGSMVVPTQADLQVFTGDEVNAIDSEAKVSGIISPSDTVLYYGYSARNLNTSGNKRFIDAAGCATPNCDTGRITLAVRVPNTVSASTPYRFTMTFVLVDEAATRVTQSTLETDDTLVDTRASDVGASSVRVLGGSSYDASATRICGAIIAVASGSDGMQTMGKCSTYANDSENLNVVITEFKSLGTEFIEVKNMSAAPVNLQGYWFQNWLGQVARLRAVTDPTGSAKTPITLAAGAVAYGVVNPASAADIPAGAGFVYGAPGSTFSLLDNGDILALLKHGSSGPAVEDLVDFRTFTSNASYLPSSAAFVGYSGASTQLTSGATAADNNTATNWCVSFYPGTGTKTRVSDTRGAANGSCSAVVINEALIDAPGGDDGKTFIELAGPGGALVGDYELFDTEGKGISAGTRNAGYYKVPAGTRIPADGILLIADGNISGATTIPNADLIGTTVDFENAGGDSIILASGTGTLVDALGYDVTGANLDTNTPAFLAGGQLYETATALYPTSPTAVTTMTLSRDINSTDTDNNRNNFHNDPTPTPGVANDTVNFTITGLSPSSTSASASTTIVTVTGTDFHAGISSKFGTAAATPCTITSTTTMNCTAPNGGTPKVVDVAFTSPAAGANTTITKTAAFTYN